jgi:polar amino acid transport system substrate-binding protein
MTGRMRPELGRRAGRMAAGLAACGLVAVLSACGASQAATVTVPRLTEPTPAGVSTLPPARLSKGSTGEAQTCHPLESLRPSGPLPKPGHMPAGSAMAKIYQRGYLIAGVDQTTDLFGYRNPLNGQLQGFDIDIARQIAQAIFGNPDRIEFKAITSQQRIPVIRSGSVDIVADSMTINCARLKLVDFSTDYFDAGQRVLVPINSPVRSISQLGHQKVCADSGTTSIETIAAEPSHPIPVAAANWTDCMVMMQQGQVAAISTDDSVLAGLQAQDPETKLVGPRFTVEPHGIAVAQGSPDLVRFVNAVLEQMRTDGRWTALYKHWIGSRLGPVPAPPAAEYRP